MCNLGYLFWQIINLDNCGQIYGSSTQLISCRNYFASNSNYAAGSYQAINMGNFTLSTGLNKLMFSSKLFYRKGTMMGFRQSGGIVSIVCNKSSSGSILKYSDHGVFTNNNTVTRLNNITIPNPQPSSTCAFEMNFIIEYTLYNGTASFNKTYTSSNVFSMTASFSDYNLTSVNSSQIITVVGEWSTWVSVATAT